MLNRHLPVLLTVRVLQGQQAVLTCPITTRVPMWQNPTGGQLTYYGQANYFPPFVPIHLKGRLSVKLNILTISNTKASDAGRYTCTYPGLGSAYVYLQVNVPQPGKTSLKFSPAIRIKLIQNHQENTSMKCVPLFKPLLHKLGLQGYTFFLILVQNIDC